MDVRYRIGSPVRQEKFNRSTNTTKINRGNIWWWKSKSAKKKTTVFKCYVFTTVILYLFKTFISYYKPAWECQPEHEIDWCATFAPLLTDAESLPQSFQLQCCRQVKDIASYEKAKSDVQESHSLIHDGYTVQMWLKFAIGDIVNSEPLLRFTGNVPSGTIKIEIRRKATFIKLQHFNALVSISYIHNSYTMNSTITEQIEIKFELNKWYLITVMVDKIMRRLTFYRNGIQVKSKESTGLMLKFDWTYERIERKAFLHNHFALLFQPCVRTEGIYFNAGCRLPTDYLYHQNKQNHRRSVGHTSVVLVLLVIHPSLWITSETIHSLNNAFNAANIPVPFVVICISQPERTYNQQCHTVTLAYLRKPRNLGHQPLTGGSVDLQNQEEHSRISTEFFLSFRSTYFSCIRNEKVF